MKVNRNGQALVLSPGTEQSIFNHPLCTPSWRLLFSICLYTGCRINEATLLRASDISATHITFRRENTKGKQKTRQSPTSPELRHLIEGQATDGERYLFPGRVPGQPITTRSADLVLRKICADLGLEGISTHSFRRTALTRMHKAGVPLKSIQMISGHSNLANLQRYLEVSEDDLIYAVSTIGQTDGLR